MSGPLTHCIRISEGTLWGGCPRCLQPADRFFWVGTSSMPPELVNALGLGGALVVGDQHVNWQACSRCKTCECVGSGLLTPPPDLDEAAEVLELSAYTEVEFTTDIGPPYQPYCGFCGDPARHNPP